MIHIVKGFHIAFQWSKSRCFTGIPLISQWSSECWQFDLWFLCLFYIQLVYLQVLGSGPAEAWLEGFWAESYLYVKWAQLYDSLYTLWHFPSLGFEKRKKKTWLFPVLRPLLSFPNLLTYKCSSSIGNKTNFKHPWMVALGFCSISCLFYRTGLSFQRWEPRFTQNSKINRITLWIKSTYPSTRQAWVWV